MLNMLNGPSAVTTPGVAGSAPVAGASNGANAIGDKSGGFGEMLASMLSDTVDSINKGEAMAMAGMQGKASVQQVVEAVMQAEQALHAATAVRDKVVGAYLEISHMSV